MINNLKYVKIFFIPLALFAFGNSVLADIFTANFNSQATAVQKSCVFDLDMSYMIKGQDADSAEVDIESKDAVFSKTIPLLVQDNLATASTTVTTALPEKSSIFYFTAKLYTGRNTRSSSGKLVRTDNATATCINQQSPDSSSAPTNQKKDTVGNFFSPVPKNSNAEVQYNGKSFNIGGIGAALSGCLGIKDSLSPLFSKIDTSSIQVNDAKANKKESCGDSLAYAASRIVVQNIARQAINWATTGNGGNPYYPTDYQSLYRNIQNTEIKSFIGQLQFNDTSNPYSSSFAKSLAQNARYDSQSFTEKYKYTGPGETFFKDSNRFSWESWFKYLEPQNNSLGYSQIASKEAEKLKSDSVATIKEELANNNGFLSQKVCDDKNFVQWLSDEEQTRNLAAAARGDIAAKLRVIQSTCKNFKIATPGSVIAKQLQEALGTPIRQAEQADEFDESLGAVFDKMVAQLVTKGLRNLSSADFKNSVDFSYNENPGYNLPAGGSFWDQYNTTFDIRRDLPGIIKTQNAYIAQVQKNNDLIVLVLKSIDRMDYALPGPHVDWADGIQQNIVDTVAGIKKEAQLQLGGIVGNLATLGIRDQILDGLERIFSNVFNSVFVFYYDQVTKKFDPSVNITMPKNSSTMIGLIRRRQAYEEIYQDNLDQITKTRDIVMQLEDINTKVKSLYTKACARFIKENPTAKCTP
jgi:hypothetical protein